MKVLPSFWIALFYTVVVQTLLLIKVLIILPIKNMEIFIHEPMLLKMLHETRVILKEHKQDSEQRIIVDSSASSR
jgi:hypothetical protein